MHCVAPGTAVRAAQAAEEATMMSVAKAFKGEVLGSSSRGRAVALAAFGKVMTRESATGEAKDTEALHNRVGVERLGEAAHRPAVSGVVEASLQQVQALQARV